jgi:hypothetical protein
MQIAIRRPYLPHMMRALHPNAKEEDKRFNGEYPPKNSAFWQQMGSMIVTHALDLIELQNTVTKFRGVFPGGSPFMAYAIYLAGTTLNYLRFCPWRECLPFLDCNKKLTGACSSLCFQARCSYRWSECSRSHVRRIR